MIADNLRTFIEQIRATGDLREISEEVDWDLELGAISRLETERDGPAVWFTNVKDYPGQSVFADPLSTWRRLAIALGLDPNSHVRDLYRAYEQRELEPIPPVEVEGGPCQQNVLRGAQVDVSNLPAPMMHDGDGGRYLGTWDLVVTRDPRTGWTNWGMYRFMIHDTQTLTGWPRSTSHLGSMLLEHYVPRGEAMPVALVIGADPLSHFAATATYAMGRDEQSLAGGLRGKPVRLCKAISNDLLVPADAEMVIEGKILPDQVVLEGPYGEYPGYRTGEMAHGILFQVEAITHRDNPILTIDCTGFKDDSSTTTSLTGAVAIRRRLERHGIPVKDVYIPPEGGVHIAVISVRQGGPDVTQTILKILTSRRALLSKIFVFDEDVDVFNMDEVLHTFGTCCHPGRGVFVTHYEGRANGISPFYSAQERQTLTGATVAFDCTWPPSWSREMSIPVKATFNHIYPQDIQERVRSRFFRDADSPAKE